MKDSISYLSIKPNLAVLFEKAQYEILCVRFYIVSSKWSIFSVFADDLREKQIDEKSYTYTIVQLLKSWLVTKKFKSIPINVFCGDWALNRYLKVCNSETVTIHKDDNSDELLYSEMMVAKYYISKNLDGVFKYKDAVTELEKLLSVAWLRLYEENLITDKFRYIAVDRLAEEYGVGFCKSYNDIIGKLLCN
jgi:hypothetical protein